MQVLVVTIELSKCDLMIYNIHDKIVLDPPNGLNYNACRKILTSVQTVGEQFAWQLGALGCQALLVNQLAKSFCLIPDVLETFLPERFRGNVYPVVLE